MLKQLCTRGEVPQQVTKEKAEKVGHLESLYGRVLPNSCVFLTYTKTRLHLAVDFVKIKGGKGALIC